MNYSTDILTYSLCFSMFFIIKCISKPNWSNRLFDTTGNLSTNTGNLVGLHLAGILWLGVVPITIFKQSFIEIISVKGSITPLWLLSFMLIEILVTASSSKASHQIQVSNKNIHVLSKRFLAQYCCARILFLCAYELFFRGLLLFACMKWFGIIPAVMITTGLTVLIHVFSDKKEMWACVPYGILASCCCISIQQVWPAIVLHLSLSLVYEMPLINKFLKQLKTVK